jgi:formylglycine-generating enzyme required for sulfatase activity
MIPWLAAIDPDSGLARRRVARIGEIPSDARALIDRLVEQHLVLIDVAREGREATVELAHEAILRQWPALKNWLIEDSPLLIVIDGVRRRARDWDTHARQTAWLAHTGARLASAERLVHERPDLSAGLGARDRAYLTACRRHERARSRWNRAVAAGFVAVVIGATGLVGRQAITESVRRFRVERPYIAANIAPYVRVDAGKLGRGATFKDCAPHAPCPEMIVVPAGTFQMSSPKNEVGRFDDEEGEQRIVKIMRPFAMSQFEITFAEWDECVVVGSCRSGVSDNGWGRGRRPVIIVSWNDAVEYTRWLSRMTGQTYRLATEAEWEFAARAGTTTRYSFGEDETQLAAYAWFDDTDGASPAEGRTTQPVGLKLPNALGFHDLHGNVWEWVADCWSANYVDAPSDGSAYNPQNCPQRVARGGSFNRKARSLRSANRYRAAPEFNNIAIGFRVVRDLAGD